MNHLEEARLLAALLGVLKKEKSSLREELLKEIHSELGSIELPEPVLVEGPQGPQGEQGPQGPRGFLGEQGPQGEVGPIGEKGNQGLPGKSIHEAAIDNGNLYLYRDDGVQFPLGNVIGEQGPIGPVGPQGLKGDKGDKGDKGETGDQGLVGAQGPIGPIGPQGNRGLQGIQGPRGERGERGQDGIQGPIGPKGDKGDRGAIGPQGLQGPQGSKGDTGETGPQGPQGEPGRDGESPDIEPYLKKVTEEQKKFQDTIRRTISRTAFSAGSSSGGGEVRLEFLDDVDRDSVKQQGKVLRYNSTTGKFEGATVLTEGGAGSGDVANTYLQATFVSNTNFQSFVANTNPRFDKYLQVANNKTIVAGNNVVISQNATSIEISSTASGGGGGGDVDLTAVSTNIVPTSNNALDLGTNELRWRDLFLSGQTINLGGATISSDGTGQIAISGSGAVLPANSRVAITGQEKTIATIGENGSAERLVPLFTQASGLTAPANTFSFRTETNTKVFTRFFLNSGAQIDADAAAAQFLF